MEQKYIISKEQYLAVKAKWAANQTSHAAYEHIVYNLLRGKPAKTGFNEKIKNIQGDNSWFAFNCAKSNAAFYVSKYKEGTFKERFGCDMPDGFLELIRGA